MSERDSMLAALDQLEQIRNELNALPRENEEGWRRLYVGIRRELQAAFGMFSRACDAWLAAGADGAEARRLRELSGAFRTRLAEHQARYPAVSIDPHDPVYWASMHSIDAARNSLAQFVRTLIR